MPEINFATNPYGRIEQIVHQCKSNEKVIQAESAAVELAKTIIENKELLENDLSLNAKTLELEETKKKPASAAKEAEIVKLSAEIADLKVKLETREEDLKKVKDSIAALREKAELSLFADSEAPSKNTQLALKKLELAYTQGLLDAKRVTREQMLNDTLNTDEIDAEITELNQSLQTIIIDFNKLNDEHLQHRALIENSLPTNASEVNEWLLNAAANPKLIEDAQNSINTIKAENKSLRFRAWTISTFVVPFFHAIAALGHAICTLKFVVAPLVSGVNYFVKEDNAWKGTLDNFGLKAAALHAYKTVAFILSAPISFVAGFFTSGESAMKFATEIKLHAALAEATIDEDLKAIQAEIAQQRIESQARFNGFKVNLENIAYESEEALKNAAIARAQQDAIKLIEIKNEFLRKYEEAKAAAKAAPKDSDVAQKAEWTAVQYLAAAYEHAFAFVNERKENMINTIIAYKKAQAQYAQAQKAAAEQIKNFNVAQEEATKALGRARFEKHNQAADALEKLIAAKAELEKKSLEAETRWSAIEDKNSQAAKLESWMMGSYAVELSAFNRNAKIDDAKKAINERATALEAEQKSYKPAGWMAIRTPSVNAVKV